MTLFKLLAVCAVILFASSHVNAAVTENNAYTANEVSRVFGLALDE